LFGEERRTVTEAEWATCDDLERMLRHLVDAYAQGQLGEQPLIRFAAACCRRVWPLITDPRSRAGVEAAELYAEGRMSLAEAQQWAEETRNALRAADNRLCAAEETEDGSVLGPRGESLGELAMALHAARAANAASACSTPADALAAATAAAYLACCRDCPDMADPAVLNPVLLSAGSDRSHRLADAWAPVLRRERAALCDLLRELVGNPFANGGSSGRAEPVATPDPARM
jgi:hypothetical protein